VDAFLIDVIRNAKYLGDCDLHLTCARVASEFMKAIQLTMQLA